MPTFKDFKLPDLGEGLTEGEILGWLVKPGDEVKLNQPIVEVETAKAAVEIPSPFAGVVTKLHHDAGTTVDVGSPIITFDTDPNGEPVAAESPDLVVEERSIQGGDLVPAEPSPGGDPATKTGPGAGRTAVLVGYGTKPGSVQRRPRKASAAAMAESPVVHQADVKQPARVSAAGVAAAAETVVTSGPQTEVHVLAKPPVRKLARDLGVDLHAVQGSGPNGTVTRGDVEAHADGATASPGAEIAPSYRPGVGERIPIKGVRKATAAAMVASAFTAPHVTLFETVDVTPTMELIARLKTLPEYAEVRVSPLLLVARALLLGVRRHPMVNSSWDESAQEIVVHGGVNLGIAAATPRGLIVPNVKGADALSLVELAQALGALTATAREGKTSPADMQHGTITITNVGVFGVDNGTPILNPGESAILCFGAVRDMPWVHEGEIKIRKVTQLTLSFDHRIVDGQLGAMFLADICSLLGDPALFTAWS